jgi:hypothetical protein
MNLRSLLPITTVVAFGAACAGRADGTSGSPESTSTVSAALSTSQMPPVPCYQPQASAPYQSLWANGTSVQLLFADAMAACSASADPGIESSTLGVGLDGRPQRDIYMTNVATQMANAVSKSQSADWLALRAAQDKNCDPVTLAPASAPVTLPQYEITERILSFFPVAGSAGSGPDMRNSYRTANAALRAGAWNLCLAQVLRNRIPGSATGATLLMTEAEQRELLDVIRQRAQIAIVQYGLLGEVFAMATTPGPGLGDSPDKDTRLGLDLLLSWAYGSFPNIAGLGAPGTTTAGQGANAKIMAAMGRDFATAVQLHAAVAKESIDLLGRSASAHAARSMTVAQLGDDAWGPGSWLQRELSAGYGGDPLAVDPGAQPSPLAFASTPGTVELLGWPLANEQPYYRSVYDNAAADKILAFARRYDALDFIVTPPPPTGCYQIDAAASGPVLYSSLEAAIRKDRCPTGQTCATAPAPGEDYLLQSLFGLRPEDAARAAQHMGETLFPPHVQECPRPPNVYVGPITLPAGVQIADVAHPPYTITNNQMHVNATASFGYRTLRERAGAFASLSTLRIPSPNELDPTVDMTDLGLYEGCDQNDHGCAPYSSVSEYKRTLGAIPALAMTREAIINAAHVNGQPAPFYPASAFLDPAASIVSVIDGEIGPDALVVEPVVQKFIPTAIAPYTPPPPTYYVTQLPAAGERSSIAPLYSWKLHITHGATDPKWTSSTFRVLIYRRADQGEWARAPQLTAAEAAANVNNAFAVAVADDAANMTADTQLGHVRWSSTPFTLQDAVYVSCDLPNKSCPPARWSFVLERTPPGSDGSATHGSPIYSLLAANVPMELGNARSALYLAFDGSLGSTLERRITPLPANPVEPAIDAFDLPTRWVPPLMAGSLGGRADQTSVDYFSTLANGSAEEAATAAKTALDGLIDAQQSDAMEAAETARALQSLQSDVQSVCGANATSCLTTADLNETNLDAKWYPAESNPPQCGANTPYPNLSQDQCNTIHSVIDVMVKSLLHTRLRIARPVLDTLTSEAVPSFTDYQGGALQSDLIEQWRAIKAPVDKLNTLYALETSALTSMDSYVLLMNNAHNHADDACSETFNWIQFAWHAYKAVGACVGVYYTGGATASTCGQEAMAAYSSAHAATDDPNCQAARSAQTSAEQASRRENADARAQMVAAVAGIFDAEAAMQQSTARIAQDLQKVTVAQAKYQLEQTLAQSTNKTSFGAYRLYHAYDLWRAMAQTESARRYALAMRRAIEAQFVVDLSTMKDDEAFVAAPASWADEVYDYDLSLPKSLGLTVGNSSNGQGLYVNKVKDYVQNLTAFVAGYAVKRPTAVSRNDIDVLTLPGLKPQTYSSQNQTTTYQDPSEWFLMCKGSTKWTTIPVGTSPGAVCPAATPAVRAKLVFELDPWGRYNGSLVNGPFGARYNGRWQELAVNFVGTGVRDCTNALDPIACGTQEYVPYNLRHVGPASVTDFHEQWHILELPVALIEGGKGLAAEIVLDPLRDGWNTSYVSPIARTELELRPLGGAYELEFEVTPEIILERIERVQLLVGSSSWVKQQ